MGAGGARKAGHDALDLESGGQGLPKGGPREPKRGQIMPKGRQGVPWGTPNGFKMRLKQHDKKRCSFWLSSGGILMAILMNFGWQKGLTIRQKRSQRGHESEKPGNTILLVFAMRINVFWSSGGPHSMKNRLKDQRKLETGLGIQVFRFFGRFWFH